MLAWAFYWVMILMARLRLGCAHHVLLRESLLRWPYLRRAFGIVENGHSEAHLSFEKSQTMAKILRQSAAIRIDLHIYTSALHFQIPSMLHTRYNGLASPTGAAITAVSL